MLPWLHWCLPHLWVWAEPACLPAAVQVAAEYQELEEQLSVAKQQLAALSPQLLAKEAELIAKQVRHSPPPPCPPLPTPPTQLCYQYRCVVVAVHKP